MIFNSAIFAAFFPFVFVIYYFLPSINLRRLWLLGASYVFYGWWDWRLLGLIIGISAISYFTALAIERRPLHAKLYLTCAVIIVLAVLGIFKYYGFFVENLFPLLTFLGMDSEGLFAKIVLPIGISFYTFQSISYMVDVYRGQCNAEKSWSKIFLYIAFFPQLIAGPIIRAKQLIVQMDRKRVISSYGFHLGFRLFLLGLIYKVAIADNLASLVDPVFSDIHSFDREALFSALLAFHSQIYFDFAGYSTMAVGLALLLGYRIPRNFKFPYGVCNPTEFWRHWHISLSNWFRDYVFIPLGGNRVGQGRWLLNIMITMSLAGLWHGAAWAFVVWGAMHGLALVTHKLWAGVSFIPQVLHIIAGFIGTQLLVLALWSTFRVDDFAQLQYLWSVLIGFEQGGEQGLSMFWPLLILPVVTDHVMGRLKGRWGSYRPSVFVFWTVIGVLIGALMFIYPTDNPAFIYFQF